MRASQKIKVLEMGNSDKWIEGKCSDLFKRAVSVTFRL